MSGGVAAIRGGFDHPMGGDGERKKRRAEEEEEDDEDNDGRGMDAWERAYADERSWEALQEDEAGLLRPLDSKTLVHAQYRKRLLLRSSAPSSSSSRIQKGLIRYLYVVFDLSRVRLRHALVLNRIWLELSRFQLEEPLDLIQLEMNVAVWNKIGVEFDSMCVYFS